jgi:hypothetical protein
MAAWVRYKLQRRSLVPLRRDYTLQDFAFNMVDGAPEVAELAVDLREDLIQIPASLRIAAHVRLSADRNRCLHRNAVV